MPWVYPCQPGSDIETEDVPGTFERKRANAVDDIRKRSIMYCEEVLPYFEKIRVHSDKLELLIDDEVWTLPKYREMLSLR